MPPKGYPALGSPFKVITRDRLWETYDGYSGKPNDIYFSPELKTFKLLVRSSVDSLRRLFLEMDLDFNTRETKEDLGEEFRLLKLITFCPLDQNSSPEQGIFLSQGKKLETVRGFLQTIEAQGVTDFRLTPVLIYKFSHKLKEQSMELVLKVYNKKNGKNFFVDMDNRVASSLIQYAKECVGDLLVCFPRDGSYDIDHQLGKVPLEFCSLSKPSRIVKSLMSIIDIVLFMVLENNFYLTALGTVIQLIQGFGCRSKSLCLNPEDRIIQEAINSIVPISSITSTISNIIIRIVNYFRSAPNNFTLLEDPRCLNFIKELEETFRVDSHPFEKAREVIRKFFEGVQVENKKALISALNCYSVEHNTGIGELTGDGSGGLDDYSDPSLESFINKTEKRGSSGCDNPGWSFRFLPMSRPIGWDPYAGQGTVKGDNRNKRCFILMVECKGKWNGVINVVCSKKIPMKCIKS